MKDEKFRCHPSIIAEKTCGIITALFFIFITSLDDVKEISIQGFSCKNLLIVGASVGVIALIFIYNIVVWAKTFITIEENTIIIQRNTINSKVNTFGIKNISNINLEQNIFERIIGTYKIKIDTDSLSTANSTDIEIILSKEHAYDFKNKILALMNNEKIKNLEDDENNINVNEVDNKNYEDDENIEYDIVYSVNDVLKHCFYNLSLSAFIFNIAMIGFVTFVSINLDESEGFITVALIVMTSCISILKFFLGDLFKYYNFSIKREKDKLYISYGLFRLKKFTVPINRINALNIKQSFISRIFKKYQSDIVTIGVGDNDTEGSQILLSSSKEDFVKNMKILLPELNLVEHLNLERESKNHYIIKIVEIVIGMSTLGLILYGIYTLDITVPLIIYLAVYLFVFVITVLSYYLSYITRGFYLGEDNMAVSWGIFAKKISIIKYKKVQYINVRETPISSRLDLCSGEIYILAGIGNDMRTLGYYNSSLFEKLKEKIL